MISFLIWFWIRKKQGMGVWVSYIIKSHCLFVDHFTHDGAVTIVLSVEVLRLVAHSVSCVANNWDLNFGVVWKLLCFTLFRGMHCNLHASWKRGKFFVWAHVPIFQTGSHRVHIEEWVFSMLNSCNRFLIKTLVTLVADCGQIKQSTLLFDFNALESKIQINGVNILPWKGFHTALDFK